MRRMRKSGERAATQAVQRHIRNARPLSGSERTSQALLFLDIPASTWPAPPGPLLPLF